MKDSWTVEFRYEDGPDWQPCGPMTADLEAAAEWMGTCSKLYTEMLVRTDNSATGYAPIMGHKVYYGNYKTVKCMFRLHNIATDEIIPGEVFTQA